MFSRMLILNYAELREAASGLRTSDEVEFSGLTPSSSDHPNELHVDVVDRLLSGLGPSGPGIIAVQGVPGVDDVRARLLPLAQHLALLDHSNRQPLLKAHGLGTDLPLKDPRRKVSSFAAQLCFPSSQLQPVPDQPTWRENPVQPHEMGLREPFDQSAHENSLPKRSMESRGACQGNKETGGVSGQDRESLPIEARHVSEALPDLGALFRQLGHQMVQVALLVARLCDAGLGRGVGLEKAMAEAGTAKGRLIHYHALREPVPVLAKSRKSQKSPSQMSKSQESREGQVKGATAVERDRRRPSFERQRAVSGDAKGLRQGTREGEGGGEALAESHEGQVELTSEDARDEPSQLVVACREGATGEASSRFEGPRIGQSNGRKADSSGQRRLLPSKSCADTCVPSAMKRRGEAGGPVQACRSAQGKEVGAEMEDPLWQQWHYDYGLLTALSSPLYMVSSSRSRQLDVENQSVSVGESAEGCNSRGATEERRSVAATLQDQAGDLAGTCQHGPCNSTENEPAPQHSPEESASSEKRTCGALLEVQQRHLGCEWVALALRPDEQSGLQVLDPVTGVSLPMDIPPGCVAIQVGEAAQILSGGQLRAAAHCVRRPSRPCTRDPGDAGRPYVVDASDVSREMFVVFTQPSWSAPLKPPHGFTREEVVGGPRCSGEDQKEKPTTSMAGDEVSAVTSNACNSLNHGIGGGQSSPESSGPREVSLSKRTPQGGQIRMASVKKSSSESVGHFFDLDSAIPPLATRWRNGATFAEFSQETTSQYYGAKGKQPRNT